MDLEKLLEEDLKYFKTNINRELLFKNLLVFTAEKKQHCSLHPCLSKGFHYADTNPRLQPLYVFLTCMMREVCLKCSNEDSTLRLSTLSMYHYDEEHFGFPSCFADAAFCVI